MCAGDIKKLNTCIKSRCKKNIGGIKKTALQNKVKIKKELLSLTKCLKTNCSKEQKAVEKAKKSKNLKKMVSATMKMGMCVSKNCANDMKNMKTMKNMENKVQEGSKCVMKKCKQNSFKLAKCKMDRCASLNNLPKKLRNSVKKKINKMANGK